MYNRYIPQPDGSYRRNQIPEPRKEPAPFFPPSNVPAVNPAPPQGNCNTCPNRPAKRPVPAYKPKPPAEPVGILHFLRQLLPKSFDAEDLLVVVLLLLLAGDCREDQNWALLTLVLYLFL